MRQLHHKPATTAPHQAKRVHRKDPFFMSAEPQPITPEQSDLFEALTSGEYSNFALVATLFDGEPTVAIATVTRDGDGEDADYIVTPVYVAVTPAMFERLTNPSVGLGEAVGS